MARDLKHLPTIIQVCWWYDTACIRKH